MISAQLPASICVAFVALPVSERPQAQPARMRGSDVRAFEVRAAGARKLERVTQHAAVTKWRNVLPKAAAQHAATHAQQQLFIDKHCVHVCTQTRAGGHSGVRIQAPRVVEIVLLPPT